MTREEKLRTMKKEALLEEAKKLGLTLSKKMRNNDIADRILAAEMIEDAVADTEKEEETMNTTIEKIDLDLEATCVNEIEEPVVELESEEEPAPKKERKAKKSILDYPVEADPNVLNLIFKAANAYFDKMTIRPTGLVCKVGNRRKIEFYVLKDNIFTIWLNTSWADVLEEYLPDTRITHAGPLGEEFILTAQDMIDFLEAVA